MDQADDAVWVREIVARHNLILRGSQTNIPGVYAGPIWYYWLSVGYFIFGGDPFGAVFLGVLRAVVLVGVLMWFLRGKIGEKKALLVGLFLSFFWWFYDTSRWSFNPFPVVTSVFVLLLLLIKFLEGRKKYFLWSAIPVFLNFSFEVAAATSILFFYSVLTLWLWWKKKINLKVVLITFALPSLFLGYVVFVLGKIFIQKHTVGIYGTPTGYFSGTNFIYMIGRFMEMLSYAVFPYHIYISSALFLGLFILFFRQKKKNLFIKNFVLLSLVLTFCSWIFFSTNHGWYDWHTVYIPPILFVSVLLLVLTLPKKFAVVALLLVVWFQYPIFSSRYLQYNSIQEGPGILSTQLKVIDWIYTYNDGDGFNVYTYMPARRDYPYQYLIWWWGLKKYKFLPCEYSISPRDLKLYVPGKQYYSKPTLGCDRLVFLIIEPDAYDDEYYKGWYQRRGVGTVLLEKATIGEVNVEKRRYMTKQELEREKK